MIPLFKVSMSDQAVLAAEVTLHSGYITQGPRVDQFERELESRLGVPEGRVIATNSGSSALALAMSYAGFGRRGRSVVISTPLTCAATNLAIMNTGFNIVWADVDQTLNISPDSVRSLLYEHEGNVAAVMMMHWGGYPCDISKINSYVRDTKLPILTIEDAAQAFGASYKGRSIGNQTADITCFSFGAIKTLTCGDGGAVVTNRASAIEYFREARWHGLKRISGRPTHIDGDIKVPGFRYNMNDIAASIGLGNLQNVDPWIASARANSVYYDAVLQGIPGIRFPQSYYRPDRESSYWLYTLLVEDRDNFIKAMASRGIETSKVHRRNDELSVFAPFHRELPILDSIHNRIVAIPVGWWVSPEDRQHIYMSINQGW